MKVVLLLRIGDRQQQSTFCMWARLGMCKGQIHHPRGAVTKWRRDGRKRIDSDRPGGNDTLAEAPNKARRPAHEIASHSDLCSLSLVLVQSDFDILVRRLLKEQRELVAIAGEMGFGEQLELSFPC